MVAFFLAASLILAACGTDEEDGPDAGAPEDDGETYLLRFGNLTSADAQEEIAEAFLARVEEESNGRIETELFTAAALGSNIDMLQSIQAGGLEGMISPTADLSTIVPEMAALSLPFITVGDTQTERIDSIGELTTDTEAGDLLRDAVQEFGFYVPAIFAIGPHILYSSSPIEGLDDLREQSFRVVPGDVHTQTFADWDVQGSAIPFTEVYTSVQQGVIDGGENAPDVIRAMGFHEVGPNLALTWHNALIDTLIFSSEWYESLPSDLQQVITDVGEEFIDEGARMFAEAQEASLETLRDDENVTVRDFPDADREEMMRLSEEGVWARMLEDDTVGPVARALQEHLEELRS